MEWQAIFVLCTLVALFVALVADYFAPDALILSALCLLWLGQVLTTQEALAGFSEPQMITVACLFVVVYPISNSPLFRRSVRLAFGDTRFPRRVLVRIVVMVLLISAFVNNTPVVAFMIPIVKDWARSNGHAPSKFLIPISYASLMGGTITIVGTSTNLVVQGLLTQAKLTPFNFFGPAYIAIPAAIVCLSFMCTVGWYLLPDKKGGLFRHAREHASQFMTELVIGCSGAFVGKKVHDVLREVFQGKATPLKLLRNRRHHRDSTPDSSPNKKEPSPFHRGSSSSAAFELVGETHEEEKLPCGDPEWLEIFPIPEDETIRPGDKLIVCCTQHAVLEAQRSLKSTNNGKDAHLVSLGGQELTSLLTSMVEVVVAPHNRFVGKAVTDPSVSRHYQCTVLAIRRGGLTVGADELLAKGGPEDLETGLAKRSPPKTGGAGQREMEAAGALSSSGVSSHPPPPPPKKLPRDRRVPSAPSVPSLPQAPPTDSGSFPERIPSGEREENGKEKRSASVPSASATAAGEGDGDGETGVLRVSNRGESVLGLGASLAVSTPSNPSPILAPIHPSASAVSSSSGGSNTPLPPHTLDGQAVTENNGMEEKEKGGDSPVDTATDTPHPLRALIPEVPNPSVKRFKIHAGDTLLLLTEKDFIQRWRESGDFYVLSCIGDLPQKRLRVCIADWGSLLVLLTIVALNAYDGVRFPIVQMVLSAAALFVMVGWVPAPEARSAVDWGTVILIGASFGLGKAMEVSGLAGIIADGIASLGGDPWALMSVLYVTVLLMTEMVSNNAAAALSVPVAIALSKRLGVSHQPLAMACMLAASSAYALPLGYQTHVMVMGPGGYSTTDFMRLGVFMDILYGGVAIALIPLWYPFNEGEGVI
uniref:Citrate transporter-like domain-containing protein n=1 Tax=Chromera velia CCMP2878 TaxID=1169474 RepID=A0A0G4GJL6_9ALVE|mmetsp:Transcript_47942/g.94584  ORF Transcript_47942/g.94584 Transcript_47942/m.94584 type:complete len:875 (-) Transcript_47942:873-3497(-)|eukprot:Cvel_22174.t1-p1 / transcript=Cvel_22174.t1 / gene=Cvel_22174 / organism=Chromera_velia_CCMP2878 / gene_product=Probable sodium/sulfate cotransporter 3, putative / transcript_product=Probable sodium/sulfate cotransporter 3, putative / location=Cvel_scaffold2152:20942-23987(+) / protein_length=874 / sequence_SO=supercontig / SO=protein_coding / is_pseudo=false